MCSLLPLCGDANELCDQFEPRSVRSSLNGQCAHLPSYVLVLMPGGLYSLPRMSFSLSLTLLISILNL